MGTRARISETLAMRPTAITSFESSAAPSARPRPRVARTMSPSGIGSRQSR